MSRTTRRPYTGSKAIDGSCRGRDGCPWCVASRTHADTLRQAAADAQLEDIVSYAEVQIVDPVDERHCHGCGIDLLVGDSCVPDDYGKVYCLNCEAFCSYCNRHHPVEARA